MSTFAGLRVAALLCCAVAVLATLRSSLAVPLPPSSSLIGQVESTDGTPIQGATITLRGNAVTRSAISDRAGLFSIDALLEGQYLLSAQASGFAPVAGRTVNIARAKQSSITLLMSVAQASSLVVLGRVTINGQEAISTAAAPSVEINAPAYAAQGVTRVSDTLTDALSTTVVPVVGGGLNAPAAVALRGPDPSETLVAVDGHQVNNGNTGDFDLSLLDPADLQSVQVVYGIAPSSLVGPDTLGGAINIRTLEPTTTSHSLLRLTAGSYDTLGETLQTRGTSGRVGYALSYHRLTSGGELNNFSVTDAQGHKSVVGNGLDATSTLAKVRYAFDAGAGFIELTLRDQAAYRDVSATLTSITGISGAGFPVYDSFAGSALRSHTAGYGLDLQVPLGASNGSGAASSTALFRHLTSIVSQSVEGPALGTSPYLLSGRDAISDDTLELTRALPHGSLSLKLALTGENLATDFASNAANNDSVARSAADAGLQSTVPLARVNLEQTDRSIGMGYAIEPTTKLHYTLAAYYSDYSTFGHSLDPRLGFVWTPRGDMALRLSIGTTFQSPQLPSLLVPSPLPAPVGGYVSVGNPNLSAEHSTEYDVGYERLFGAGTHQAHLDVDVYRTDINNGIAIYFPPTICDTVATNACLSYPINVNRVVYTGLELQGDEHLGEHASVRANYGVDSAYTRSFPASTQDGTIVAYEQLLGVPLHKATLTLAETPSATLDYYAAVLYESSNNELNRGAFATLRAGITAHLRSFDVGVYGTNLTNVYDAKFTLANGGVPYAGAAGPLPTDAYALAGRAITVVLTKRI